MTIESGESLAYALEMEARLTRLESAIECIQRDMNALKADLRSIRCDMRTDCRIMIGALIATAPGLAGVMAKGFGS